MKNLKLTAVALATSLSFGASAMAESMSNQGVKPSTDRIEMNFKSDISACKSLSGNANDICEAEAKGKQKIAKANLEAANKNTDKARYDALIAKAEADYSVAKERCDDLSGNDKDVCQNNAKATEDSAKANAKAHLKTSDARGTTSREPGHTNLETETESSRTQRDAKTDNRDADYSVAKERCDSLSGAAKENCISTAKSQHGN